MFFLNLKVTVIIDNFILLYLKIFKKYYTIINSLIMKKKIALITGITGQDGSYLAEFLLNKNYFVHGIKENLHHLILSVLIIFMKINYIRKGLSCTMEI